MINRGYAGGAAASGGGTIQNNQNASQGNVETFGPGSPPRVGGIHNNTNISSVQSAVVTLLGENRENRDREMLYNLVR